jgi:very-short-patch-repair endonuclease
MKKTPFNVNHPFTRAQWIAAGMALTLLRRRDFQQVIGSVWVHRDGVDDDTLIRAALAIHPEDAFASHLSAAKVLRLPIPDHPVILGDALVKKYGLSAAALLTACLESTDYYAGLAAAAARYVRDGVDSPMETRLRMLIVLAGLPEPDVNFKLYREDGTWRRRFDLCYSRIKLIVEYDGRQHAENREQWDWDLERREEFDDEGYRILVVTSKGIFLEPERTLQRVRRQLLLRGWGAVPPIQPRWKDHFAA